MSWSTDKAAALLWLAGGLVSLLLFFGNQMFADVQSLKESRAANVVVIEEVNRRLERIESKIDQLINVVQEK